MVNAIKGMHIAYKRYFMYTNWVTVLLQKQSIFKGYFQCCCYATKYIMRHRISQGKDIYNEEYCTKN